jgi:hypothetical protein
MKIICSEKKRTFIPGVGVEKHLNVVSDLCRTVLMQFVCTRFRIADEFVGVFFGGFGRLHYSIGKVNIAGSNYGSIQKLYSLDVSSDDTFL